MRARWRRSSELSLATVTSAVSTLFRCPPGYHGLSCETCSPGFERVPGGSYLGTCAGCNCNGHASACDPVNGHCLVLSGSGRSALSSSVIRNKFQRPVKRLGTFFPPPPLRLVILCAAFVLTGPLVGD